MGFSGKYLVIPIKFFSLLLVLVLGLSACSWFGGKDNGIKPNPLTPYE